MSVSSATKPAIEGEILHPAPAPRPPAVIAGEGKREGRFEDVLQERMIDIAPMLAPNVSKERFIAAAHAMVRNNPDLLDCTQRSIFSALTKAAQDGLLPDGREGVIVAYNEKSVVNGKEVWSKTAQWNAMTHGLRKRARECDHILVDAQVVHEKDHFVWHQGDDARIEHEPAKLGTPRGNMIGVYALFRREGDGAILHREVMDRSQVMATKEQSRAKTSLLWTKFETEGWRKAVIRRGMKTLPVSEDLDRIIRRDDENYDFSAQAPAALTPPPIPPKPPSPPQPSAAQTEGAHVIPPPEASTDGAAAIELPMKGDKPHWVQWGKALIDKIMASQTHAEMDAWRAANAKLIDRCEKEAPKAFSSIQKAVAKRSEELAGAQAISASEPSVMAPNDEAYSDWLREVYDDLTGCRTGASVDEMRERISPELRESDRAAWKDACATRAEEIFNEP